MNAVEKVAVALHVYEWLDAGGSARPWSEVVGVEREHHLRAADYLIAAFPQLALEGSVSYWDHSNPWTYVLTHRDSPSVTHTHTVWSGSVVEVTS